jgi:hypothetical protein
LQPIATELLCVHPILRNDKDIPQILDLLLSNPTLATKVQTLEITKDLIHVDGGHLSNTEFQRFFGEILESQIPLLATYEEDVAHEAANSGKVAVPAMDTITQEELVAWIGIILFMTPNLRTLHATTDSREIRGLITLMYRYHSPEMMQRLCGRLDTLILTQYSGPMLFQERFPRPHILTVTGTAPQQDPNRAETAFRALFAPQNTVTVAMSDLRQWISNMTPDSKRYVDHCNIVGCSGDLENLLDSTFSHPHVMRTYPMLKTLNFLYACEVDPVRYASEQERDYLGHPGRRGIHLGCNKDLLIFRSVEAHARLLAQGGYSTQVSLPEPEGPYFSGHLLI